MSLRKKWMVGIALLLLLLLSIPAVQHWRNRRALGKYRAELLQKGEQLDLSRITPKSAADSQNGAFDFQRAADQLSGRPFSPWREEPPPAWSFAIPGRAMPLWRKELLVADRKTNTWTKLGQDLERIEDLLEEIRLSVQAPRFDFGLNYAQGFSLLVPHLAQLKGTAQKLGLSASYHLHQGELDAASADLKAVLGLARVGEDEPLLISQLVRIAVTHLAMADTWAALQAEGWQDPTLAELQGEWQRLEFIQALERSLIMERAMSEKTIANWRKSPEAFARDMALYQSFFSGPGPISTAPGNPVDAMTELFRATSSGFHARWWRWFWSYQDELRALKVHQILLEGLRGVRKTHSAAGLKDFCDDRLRAMYLEKSANENGFNFAPGNRMFTEGALASRRALAKAMVAETLREMAVTAIALHRFKLRHGSYPSALPAIVPDFLERPPIDYMDGQSLRYRPDTAGGFILYSVGENFVDDGGNALSTSQPRSRNWLEGQDWVWPHAADGPASSEQPSDRQR